MGFFDKLILNTLRVNLTPPHIFDLMYSIASTTERKYIFKAHKLFNQVPFRREIALYLRNGPLVAFQIHRVVAFLSFNLITQLQRSKPVVQKPSSQSHFFQRSFQYFSKCCNVLLLTLQMTEEYLFIFVKENYMASYNKQIFVCHLESENKDITTFKEILKDTSTIYSLGPIYLQTSLTNSLFPPFESQTDLIMYMGNNYGELFGWITQVCTNCPLKL